MVPNPLQERTACEGIFDAVDTDGSQSIECGPSGGSNFEGLPLFFVLQQCQCLD